jgi:hypothetical protein
MPVSSMTSRRAAPIGEFAPLQAARHRLPESGRPATLEQQKFTAIGVDHDQDGFRPPILLTDRWIRSVHSTLGATRTRMCSSRSCASLTSVGASINRICRRLGLREGDHVANAVGSRHQHRQPIQSEGDAAVGRRAVLQRIQQEPELRARLFRGNAEQVEHHRLAVPEYGCAPSRRRSQSRSAPCRRLWRVASPGLAAKAA